VDSVSRGARDRSSVPGLTRTQGPGRPREIARDERKPGKKGTPAPSDHASVFVDLT
jgi:hypothetical protein